MVYGYTYKCMQKSSFPSRDSEKNMADKVKITLKSTGSARDKSVDKMGSKVSFLSESYGLLKFRPSEMHMEVRRHMGLWPCLVVFG